MVIIACLPYYNMQFHYRMPQKECSFQTIWTALQLLTESNPLWKRIIIVSCYLFEFVALVIDDVINSLRGMAIDIKAQEVHKSIDLYLTRKVTVFIVWTNARATKRNRKKATIGDGPLPDNVTPWNF